MGNTIKVYQVLFDTKSKKTLERTDITSRFKGQHIGMRELEYELRFKKEALEGKHGNVYYECVGIDYDSLNISEELREFVPKKRKRKQKSL